MNFFKVYIDREPFLADAWLAVAWYQTYGIEVRP